MQNCPEFKENISIIRIFSGCLIKLLLYFNRYDIVWQVQNNLNAK